VTAKQQEAGVAQRPRVALWDNARFALIALVVVGHAIATVRGATPLGYGLYVFIYLFHMPAFIALTGAFSKAEATPRVVRSTVQLLVTWLMWEGIWALIRLLSEGRWPGERWLVAPAWTLWFLVTLATMRILLPYVARLRHPFVVSVVLALAAGLSPAIGTAFSAQRTLCLLPFFVGAWLARERGWFERERFLRPGPGLRAAGWAVFAAVAAVLVALPGLRDVWRVDSWVTWNGDYASLLEGEGSLGDWAPEQWWQLALGGVGVRAALLAIAAAMTLALLVVIPRTRGFVSVWGTRTLYVYLLHGPIVWALRETGAVRAIGSLGEGGVLILVAIGAAIAVVLSSGWVARVFRPVIEPRLNRLFAREPAR
jgi:fucose 4-O-acetylase-like acetyltransferase